MEDTDDGVVWTSTGTPTKQISRPSDASAVSHNTAKSSHKPGSGRRSEGPAQSVSSGSGEVESLFGGSR
jgi:hypothetical protein